MNRLKLALVLFLGIIMLAGCNKWTEPEFEVKEWDATGINPLQFWTIGGRFVVGKHTNGTPPDSLVPHFINKDKFYIRAVVVSSDEGGNYYKKMVIQDHTGGVELQLDMNGLYNMYPVGQKIVLVCNGLVVGDYRNLPQIGWIYNQTQVGRINSLFFDQYIIKDGLPSPNNLPKPLINNGGNKPDGIDFLTDDDLNKLVRLENVTFEPAAFGKQLADNAYITDWKITVPRALPTGTGDMTVTIRTSNYAKFRNTIIQDKEYHLTGILTKYNNIYQLMIRTKDDIVEASQGGGVVSFNFTKNPFGEGWNTHSVLGNTPWIYRENIQIIRHPGNRFAGYNTAMDDWFVSPEITFSDVENGFLRFEYQLNAQNGDYSAYQIYYTTSKATTFSPADWKLLGTIDANTNNYEWSKNLPIKNINADKFRIAFRYYAPNTNVETYEWDIKRVEIRN